MAKAEAIEVPLYPHVYFTSQPTEDGPAAPGWYLWLAAGDGPHGPYTTCDEAVDVAELLK